MNTHTTQTVRRSSSLVPEVESIAIFHYASQAGSIKNQITLRQNLFSFLLEGEKTVYYAGTSVQIKPGQFLLLSAGNCLMSEKTAGKAGRYQSLLISFDNNLLADFFIRHSETLHTSISKGHEEPFLQFEQDGFLANYLESLQHLLGVDGSISPGMRAVKLEELLLYLNQTHPGHLQKLHLKSQEATDELLIRQAVSASLDHPVTLEELAFLCHVSLSTFKRRFAHLYGNSPTKWFLEKRMQKAARLLRQDKLKASEIYNELGYENLSSFIQSFKQLYGMTPKQYQVSKLAGTDPDQ
ncbi:AraC family transcriptional regulator [soil metagenome]